MGFMLAYRTGMPGAWSGLVSDLMVPGALPPGVTYSRASAGWYFNASLSLASASVDVPRWTYDPSSGALLGLLVEPAATNAIRNSAAGGAVPGIVGTTPTNWSCSSTSNGVTREVIGSGAEDGIPYLDIKYSGTPSASASISLFAEGSATFVAASSGQTWTGSWFIRVVGGSTANASVGQYLTERNSAGSSVVGSAATIVPTNAALRTQRFDLVRTLNGGAATVAVTSTLSISYTLNQTMDLTLRLGLPGQVQAAAPTSPIVTTSSAVTRAASVLSWSLANGTYDIDITRASGLTALTGAVVSGGSYTVPTDPSPLQRLAARRTA